MILNVTQFLPIPFPSEILVSYCFFSIDVPHPSQICGQKLRYNVRERGGVGDEVLTFLFAQIITNLLLYECNIF